MNRQLPCFNGLIAWQRLSYYIHSRLSKLSKKLNCDIRNKTNSIELFVKIKGLDTILTSFDIINLFTCILIEECVDLHVNLFIRC